MRRRKRNPTLSFDEEILVECIDSKFKEKINIEIVSLKRINNLIWKLKELKVINKFNFKSKFTDKNYIDIVCNNNSDPIFWIEIAKNIGKTKKNNHLGGAFQGPLK